MDIIHSFYSIHRPRVAVADVNVVIPSQDQVQNIAADVGCGCHIKKSRVSLIFLKQLKRAGAGLSDLLNFYCSVIRPVLEYAIPVWHSSLTVAQTKSLEYLSKEQ